MNNSPTLLALALALTMPLAAQEPEMPTPGPQHEKLAAMAGVWDAKIETLGPTGWMTTKGVSNKKVMTGGFWLVDDFTGEVMGSKYVGHGLNGYDPMKGKYVATWTDSMSPSLTVMEGSYDDSGKVLTMTGKSVGMDGTLVDYRYVTTTKSDTVHVFEMFMPGPDGNEMKIMKISYTRRGAKAADSSSKKGR